MPNSPERRHAPRYELIAQANLASGDESYLMTVRNISTTGAFLEGNPAEHPDLQPGVELDLILSASAPGMGDDEVDNIHCRGRVARIESAGRGGFGITIEPMTKDDAVRLKALIGRLAHLPPPRPASLRA